MLGRLDDCMKMVYKGSGLFVLRIPIGDKGDLQFVL